MNLPNLPSFEPYGKYSSANYGAHAIRFDVGPLSIWYSYGTPVAFQVAGGRLAVRQNEWGPTSGKHLNAIDGGNKADRIPGEQFERQLGLICDRISPVTIANIA